VFIPLRTDRPLNRPTLVNHVLLAANLAIYAVMAGLELTRPETFLELRRMFWLNPQQLTAWGLLTYAFLHGGLMHLLGNMIFLWVFGPSVEDRLGRIGYLAFYLVGAVAAGAVHAMAYPTPVVGASGAIAAVTGAYLVLFPRTQVQILIIFFLIGVYSIPATWFIGGQIAWNLFLEASGRSGRIATLAHLAGYAYGFAISMSLLATGVLKREVYDLFSISKHAARRRQFQDLGNQRRRAERAGKLPDVAHRRAAADEATIEKVAAARAEVSSFLEAGDHAGAARAYRSLLDSFSGVAGATLLARGSQYQIANAAFAEEDHHTAARAYELFVEGYPSDPETPVMRLMLGLICARYLNDPVAAKRQISAALPNLPEDQRGLAREILAELG
jgi:membrane associated rhomboid family serine protease